MEIPRVTGLPQAVPNGETKDIRFLLSIENSDPLGFVAHYGAAIQVASTLGAAVEMLRSGLAAQGAVVEVPAQELRTIRFQKSLMGDSMAIELRTNIGIPYVFQFPLHMIDALIDQLRTEADKDRPAGRA